MGGKAVSISLNDGLSRELFDIIKDFLFLVDRRGTLIRANRALLDRLGRRAEDLIGRSATILFSTEGLKESNWPIDDAWDNRSGVYTAALVGRTGELIPTEITVTPWVWDGRKTSFCHCRDISRRLILERSLATSERNYRLLVDNTIEGIAVNQAGRWVWVNPKLADLCQTSVAEMTGAVLHDFVHPDDRDMVARRCRRRMEGREVQSTYDFRLIGRSGKVTWVMVSAVRIRWENQPAALCFISDVSPRKAAEEKVAEMSSCYHTLFDATLEAAVCIKRGVIVTANQAAADVFGYDLEELLGMEPSRLIAPMHREAAVANMDKGHDRPYEALGLRKNGQIFPIILRGKTLTIQGRPVRIAVGRDISGQRKARLEQTAAQDIFRAIPVGLYLYQHQPPDKLILIYGNPASERLTGLRAQNLVGRELNDIWPAAKVDGITEALLNVVRTGRSFETERLAYDGPRMATAHRIKAFVMSGQRLGVTIEEETERRRNQEEKKELAAQLRQAQKMEALGVLAGGIAHDFNNILTAIIGYSELNLKDLAPETQTGRRSANILQAGLRARELVNQILTFSRQDESKKEVINLASLIDEVMKMIRGGASAAVHIDRIIESDRLSICGNSGQLHQLLVNLCTNAVDAMRETGGSLSVTLNSETRNEATRLGVFELGPGRYAVLSIADNGPGMAEEILDRIFEPFYTTKPRGQGIGMGLAVVHGVVKNHCGAIDVDTALGRGTVFRVYLPLVEEKIEQPSTDRPEEPAGGAERILFVDDERAIVELVEEILTSLGYRVSAFTSVRRAWEAYRRRPDYFDLVMTDWNMPEISGPEFIRRVRTLRPGAASILCTGYNDPVRENGIREAGINLVISKPFTVANLARAVRQALDGEGRGEETGPLAGC